MFDFFLSLDTSLLIEARGLVGPEYAKYIQIFGESVVLWGGSFLLFLWIEGIRTKDYEKKTHAMMIFATVILTFIVYTLINFGFDKWRPSPQEVVGGIAPLIPHPLDNSFPSGHALFTGAFLVGIIFLEKNIYSIGLTLLFGFVTAFCRVVGGVHYPGDILGGWIFGTLGGLLFVRVVGHPALRKYIYENIIKIASFLHL